MKKQNILIGTLIFLVLTNIAQFVYFYAKLQDEKLKTKEAQLELRQSEQQTGGQTGPYKLSDFKPKP